MNTKKTAPKIVVIFVCFFNTLSAWSLEPLTGFCFTMGTDLKQVEAYLSPLLLPKERLDLRHNLGCVELPLGLHRKPLFERYLNKRYPIIRSYAGTGNSYPTRPSVTKTLKNCRIEVLKITDHTTTTDTAKAGQQSRLNQSNSKGSEISKSQLLLGEGLGGHLEVDGDRVELTCFYRGLRREIQVTLNSATGSLQSSIMASIGEKIDLGSVVKEIKDKNREIGYPKGIEYEKTKGNSSSQIFVTVTE